MQVAERIRVDSRLTIKDRTNLRYMTLDDMPGRHAASTLVLYRLSFQGENERSYCIWIYCSACSLCSAV